MGRVQLCRIIENFNFLFTCEPVFQNRGRLRRGQARVSGLSQSRNPKPEPDPTRSVSHAKRLPSARGSCPLCLVAIGGPSNPATPDNGLTKLREILWNLRVDRCKQGATHILPGLVIRSQLNCVCPCDFRHSIPASLRRTRHSSWKQADRSAAVTSATPLISPSAMKASRFSPKTGRADSLGRTTSPVRSGSPPERDSRACPRLA